MDITPVSSVTIPRQCMPIPCGQCEACHRVAMLNMAAYAAKEEDPKGALLDLLSKLGLPSSGSVRLLGGELAQDVLN
jgi:hypothetical protein